MLYRYSPKKSVETYQIWDVKRSSWDIEKLEMRNF